MSIVCRLKGHKWPVTGDGKEGCTCARCGTSHFSSEFGYDFGHSWQKQPGSCNAVCAWCSDEKVIHDWKGCVCAWCGAKRNSDHSWEPIPGACDLRCSVCGEISAGENHKWKGCTCERCGEVRNEGHDFSGAEQDGSEAVCAICGKGINQCMADTALELLKKADRTHSRREEEEATGKARQLVARITRADVLPPLAKYHAGIVFKRMSELGEDEMIARMIRDDSLSYGARRYGLKQIRDAGLRNSITIPRDEKEDYWYDYDIKSGM